MRMAAGIVFLHWKGSRPAKVLYIDGEMSRRLLRERLLAEEGRLLDEVGECNLTGFHAMNTEDIPNFQPLNTPEGRAAIEKIIAAAGGYDFIVFDNVMSLISGSMADEEACDAQHRRRYRPVRVLFSPASRRNDEQMPRSRLLSGWNVQVSGVWTRTPLLAAQARPHPCRARHRSYLASV
jgi:hypothetical protein